MVQRSKETPMDKEFEANFNIFLTFHRKANQGIKFLLSDDKKMN